MKNISFVILFFLAACSPKIVTTTSSTQSNSVVVDGKLFATIFQQRTAEYRALCFQAFNIARLRLDNYKAVSGKPKAIITDIDETVLDNSPYQAKQVLLGKDFDPVSWAEWTDKGAADSIPGAVSFLQYAASKGVTVFYVTNRNEKDRAGTIKNLKQYNFPNADDAHFIPKKDESSKEKRRLSVASTYEIIMLLGDNLADFSNLFDKKTYDDRMRNTTLSAADFGNRFIVIPNPVYGDWENAIYGSGNKYTLAQKDSVLKAVLKTY